jgi:hypothetical protein
VKAACAAIALCAAVSVARAQPERLEIGGQGEPPVIIVLTFGTGEDLFEKWGHSAVCFDYPHSGHEPVCFNYGVTDFDATGDLVWGFLRGEQVFWMEPDKMSTMIGVYKDEDRDIYEQRLAVAPAAAMAVEHKVLGDLDGFLRYYIYDHFFDNCSTRIRDIVDLATAGKLRAGTDVAYPLTYRALAYRGLADAPLARGVGDFVLGRPLDDHPTVWEAMFLPDVLRQEIAAQLGVAPTLVYKRKGPAYPDSGPSGRIPMLALALVFAVPLALARWRKRFERTALAWATVWLAGWGVLLWTLAALSGIAGVRYNEAVLVLVPFDVVLPFLGAGRRRTYVRARVAMLLVISALSAIGVLHQPLWIPIVSAIVPLALAT